MSEQRREIDQGSGYAAAPEVPEERSIYDRGEAEVVASPQEAGDTERGGATWREDVRVDPERARELLRPTGMGNDLRGRGDRDVLWRGEDDQWSALFRDEERQGEAGRSGNGMHEGHEGEPGRLTDREVQRATAREPEVDDRASEPEGLASAMLRGAVAGALGALALQFAAPRAAAAAPDDAPQSGELRRNGLTLGFGAFLGAVYGAVQSRWEPPALLHAAALSGLSLAATTPEAARRAVASAADRLGTDTLDERLDTRDAHVAFALTTAAAYDVLRP